MPVAHPLYVMSVKTALAKAVSLTPSIVMVASTIFQLFVFFNEFELLGIVYLNKIGCYIIQATQLEITALGKNLQ